MTMITETKAVVGRNESVSFSKIAIDVPAKIDTGADSSSVWASNIRVDRQGVLKFSLFGEGSPYYTGKTIKREQYAVASVKSSNGQEQIRYRVRLSLRLGGKRIRASFTLTDRSTQAFPVLIGRRTLVNKFIVDVTRATHESPAKEITKVLNKKLSKDPYKFYKKHYKKAA